MTTKIEWATETWNPITGCTKISEGCQNCYAERMSKRLAGRFGYPKDDPFRPGTFHNDKSAQPFNWRKSRKIFVSSMGDLFHEAVSDTIIGELFAIMGTADWHTYLILTKRPERMREFILKYSADGGPLGCFKYTFSHLWLGVTAENQRTADERIPILLQIPAAVRFVSVEPMLEFVDLSYWLNGAPEQYAPDRWQQTYPPLDWVIAGPETGPKARKADNEWFRDLRRQCFIARVPYFLKKTANGGRLLDGREWSQYPGGQNKYPEVKEQV